MNPITSTIRKKSRLLNPVAKQRQKMSGYNLNSESNQTAYQTRLISWIDRLKATRPKRIAQQRQDRPIKSTEKNLD